MRNYQRLSNTSETGPGDSTSESETLELQNLDRNEDQDQLLSSFRNDEEQEEGASAQFDTSDAIDSQDTRLPVSDEEVPVGTSSSAPEPALASAPDSAPPTRHPHRVPNTIVHRLINNPRVSRYVPHLIRNYYQPVYTGRPMGQGLANDGVFTNMSAKPSTHADLDESLPSYEQAAMDTSPPYWESSVISPGFEDEVFVDGLPVGSVINFLWNFIVSFSFQFIGFFLTYLLHTSHGSKEGSRAGLGLTFMNFGYGLLPVNYYNKGDSPISKFEPNDPNFIDVDGSQTLDGHIYPESNTASPNDMVEDASMLEDNTKTPYFAFVLIALGLFILLKSIIDYHRARQTEKRILNPNYDTTTTTAQPPEHTPDQV